jgi:hypothetical protein
MTWRALSTRPYAAVTSANDRMREKYLQAAQTLALMPGSHVAQIVKAVKHSATPEFLVGQCKLKR